MANQHTVIPMPGRFWQYVQKGEGCWQWRGSRQRSGYGVFRNTVAHRVAYTLTKGPVPEGLELDHLCGNRGCVRPDHLEAVTRRENIMRSGNFAAVNAAKTHCPKGHPYSGANLHVGPNGDRRCLTCKTAHNAARDRRLRSGSPAPEGGFAYLGGIHDSPIWEELSDELDRACSKFGPMAGPHEGWAVIREEVDELWDDVKANRGRGPEARTEALQIAAMALRYILDVSAAAAPAEAREEGPTDAD